MTFYGPTRLAQDIEAELATDGKVAIVRLIVLERVTIENMRRAVAGLDRVFFDEDRPA